jgi:hypothetical protein
LIPFRLTGTRSPGAGFYRGLIMGSKTQNANSALDLNDADELRVAVKQLNESVAYLSKMVLQLQRSVGSKSELSSPSREKPDTIH